MKEIIDVVDENNQLTGVKKEKLQAHREGCWHRTTQIWVINEKGEILVGKRSLSQYQDPGKWASYFGGHLLSGESYEEGALREIKEELGLKGEEKLRKVELRKNPGPNEFVQIFVFRLEADEKLCISKEIDQWRFLSPKELLEWAIKEPQNFSGGEEYIRRQLGVLR